MEDFSPDSSMIVKTLKDFDRFIKSGSGGNNSANNPWTSINSTPRMQLNFSNIDEDETQVLPIGNKRKASDSASNFVKRHKESVAGFGKLFLGDTLVVKLYH